MSIDIFCYLDKASMTFKTLRVILPQFLGLFSQTGLTSAESTLKDKDVPTKEIAPSKDAGSGHIRNFDTASCKAKALSLMLEKGIPGMTICVSHRGEIVWNLALGCCDVENLTYCDPDASMRIASISKAIFAATIVAPMLEKKLVDLNSSIYDYLTKDEFPRQKFDGKEYDITVEQLLSHTAGITHYPETPGDWPLKPIGSKGSKRIYQNEDQFNQIGYFQRKRYRSVIEALEPFKDGPLIGCPGENFRYTTYGFTLLSAVMQKVLQSDKETSEVQIEDYWINKLRKDWSLKITQLDYDEEVIPKRSRYYFRSAFNGGLMNAPYADSSVKWAGGGLISNARDLASFGNTMIECYKGRKNSPIDSKTVRTLWTERKNKYGLGFFVEGFKEGAESTKDSVAWHSGSAVGASSILMIYPDSEVVVAILTNMGSINLAPLGRSIAETFIA